MDPIQSACLHLKSRFQEIVNGKVQKACRSGLSAFLTGLFNLDSWHGRRSNDQRIRWLKDHAMSVYARNKAVFASPIYYTCPPKIDIAAGRRRELGQMDFT